MSEPDTIMSGFKMNLLAKATEIGTNGLLVLLLTRVYMSTGEYGLLNLALSIFGIAVFFSRMGFAKSAARYVTEYRETEPSKIPLIVGWSLALNGFTIVLVSVALVVFRKPIIAQFGEPELLPLFSLGVLFVVTRTIRAYAYFLCQGFNRVSWSAILSIVSNLSIFTFVLGFLESGFGIAGALLGYVVGYALGATLGLFVLYRLLLEIYPDEGLHADTEQTNTDAATDSSDKRLIRRILDYSIPLTITGASSILYKRVDIVLIGAFASPIAVGYYVLAKQLTEFVAAPASSLGFAVAPTYGESKSNDDLERAANIYETTFEHNLLFYIPAAAGIGLVADPAIRHVFGHDYLGAIPIVQVLSLFVVLESINKITNGALDFLGRARHRAISKGGTAMLNVGLNIVLIPTIGATGAAIATVISYVIMVIVNIYLINTELPLSLRGLFLTTCRVCSIAIGMSLIVVFTLPYVTDVLSLIAIVVLGTAVWLALAVTSGLLNLRWAIAQLS